MKRIAWVFTLALCLVFPSCGSIDVTSTLRNRDVVIDADAKDWSGLSLYTEKKVSFAVCNDSTYLYILLTTSDRALQRQLAATGVNIWFDPAGSSDKIFGIHYPVRTAGGFGPQRGNDRGGMQGGPDGMQGGPGDMQGNPGDMQGDPGERPPMMEVNSNELEILGPEDDDKEIVTLTEAKDLQLKMSATSGILVFELRVPLVRDPLHPHGIGSSIANAIGVGVETPKFDFPKMGEGRGMGPQGGQDGEGSGMGGGGGMPPGGMGGGGGRGRPGGGAPGGGGPGGGGHPGGGSQKSSSESVSLWANVKLAGR